MYSLREQRDIRKSISDLADGEGTSTESTVPNFVSAVYEPDHVKEESKGESKDGLFSVLEAAQALGEPSKPKSKPRYTYKNKYKKKIVKRPQKPCKVEGCEILTARYGLCSQHGGATKCKVELCFKVDRGAGFCTQHDPTGAQVLAKECKIDDCMAESTRWGLCPEHGGVAKCKWERCTKNAQGCGYCAAHGGGYRCKFEGCMKYNQGGVYCMAHGGRGKKKPCKVVGCGVIANLFGLCVEHGGIDPITGVSQLATRGSVTLVTGEGKGEVGAAGHVETKEQEVATSLQPQPQPLPLPLPLGPDDKLESIPRPPLLQRQYS